MAGRREPHGAPLVRNAFERWPPNSATTRPRSAPGARNFIVAGSQAFLFRVAKSRKETTRWGNPHKADSRRRPDPEHAAELNPNRTGVWQNHPSAQNPVEVAGVLNPASAEAGGSKAARANALGGASVARVWPGSWRPT